MAITIFKPNPTKHSAANTRSFYAILILVLILSFWLLRPYLSLVFLGFMTAWAFKGVYRFFYNKFWNRVGLAVTATTILVFLTILLPLALFLNMALQQMFILSRDVNNLVAGRSFTLNNLVASVNQFLAQIPWIEYEISRIDVRSAIENIARPVGNFLLDRAISLGSSAPELLARTILFIIIFASFLPQTDRFLSYLKKLSPLDDHANDLYIKRIIAMTSSMIKGTFIISFIQALVGVIVLWVVGFGYLFILFLMMLIMGILPVIGASTVMIPIGLLFLLTGGIWQGVLILATTLIVITNLDNVLRPILVSRDAMINPALLIMGVFGGIGMFGMLGVIYGPVLMIVLVTTLEIYTNYYPVKKKTGI